MQLAGAPSIFFDAVAVIVSETEARELAREAAALDFISDAFNHLKVIGYVPAAKPLLHRAGITDELVDGGIVKLAEPMPFPALSPPPRKLASGTASQRCATSPDWPKGRVIFVIPAGRKGPRVPGIIPTPPALRTQMAGPGSFRRGDIRCAPSRHCIALRERVATDRCARRP